MRGPIVLLLVPLFALTSPRVARSVEDLELLEADEGGVSFVYSPPEPRASPLEFKGDTFRMLTVEGCSYSEETGKPQLPVKFVHLGIPLGSEVRMKVLGTEDSLLTRLRVAPVPRIGGDSLPAYLWEVNEEFYGQDRMYPQSVGEVVEVGTLRNQSVVRLRLSPCQYNPKKLSLTWHKKMRVRVDFSGGGKRPGPLWRRDLFEEVYRSTLLNYEQARSFRGTIPSRVPLLLEQHPWYKLSTVKEGLYKITRSDLEEAGISLQGVDPRTLKIYNGGSTVVPHELSTPKPDTIPYQVAIYVYGEDDGSFDEGDYVLFYGLSLHGWGKNEVPGNVSLYHNPYADTNCYWLTWGGERGERMKRREGSAVHSNPYEPHTFEDTTHIEENRECPAHSGFGWVWDTGLVRFGSQESYSKDYWAEIQGVAEGETSRTVFVLYGADTDPPLTHAVRIWVNGVVYSDSIWTGSPDRKIYVQGNGMGLRSGLNRFTVEVYRDTADFSEDNIYLDYFEVFYRRRYEAHSKRLRFSTWGSPLDTTYEFSIENLGECSVVIDVTDPFRPERIVNHLIYPSHISFQDRVVDTPKAYFGACGFLSPLRIAPSSWRSLRDHPGADWVAICYDTFLDGLTPLKEWRRNHLRGTASPVVKVVRLSEVYDNFSWGVPDPTGIRDFLKYAYENWDPIPAWCFLLGAGTFDYKNLKQLSNRKNFVPPYEEDDWVVGNFSLLSVNHSYDDWFVYLNDDGFPDMAIGRTTAESPQETRWVADKVVEYEKAGLGVWRNRVLLIADDEFRAGQDEGVIHTRDTESLYRMVPRDVDVVKVYLMEYEGYGDPMTKPGARDDIIKHIDEGVALGSFLGHGSYRRLTHETVVYNPQDINALRNERRQPFFYYGSCEVGEFEREADRSLADFMQKQKDRGAIATLGATRTTGPTSNAALGRGLFERLLSDSAVTVGEAVVGAKIASGGNRLYVLFGDPATQFSLPQLDIDLTVSSDTLKGGKRFTVDGVVSAPLSGYVYLTAFDSEVDTFHTTPGGSSVNYTLPGSPIFKGMTGVENGEFSQSFVVPLDLKQRPRGRVSCYVWDGSRAGHGAVDSLVCGVDTTGADTLGPGLTLLVNGRPVTHSSRIPPNSNLEGICSDESGINITSQDGVSMSLVIDGNIREAVPLYEHFAYDFGTDTSGSFSYPLPALDPRTAHILKVRVSDNLKNLTLDSAVVNIASAEQLELKSVMNYPNPFSRRTWFTFDLNQQARVTVKIYTIRGRLIKIIEEPNCAGGFNKIPQDGWAGLDEDGDPIANGVYLYKVIAKTEREIPDVALPQEMMVEVIEKLVVMR